MQNASIPHYQFKRLYRNLYNELFYDEAYTLLFNKPMPSDIAMRVATMIKQLKQGCVQPSSIQAIEIALLQEVVRRLLSCIYMPALKGCFTQRQAVLAKVAITFSSTKWLVVIAPSDVATPQTKQLIQRLRQKIQDERLLHLIELFYRMAPVGKVSQTLNQLLLNIYWSEVDYNMQYHKQYVRFGTHLLIGMNGNKKQALALLKQLQNHIENDITLRLQRSLTLVSSRQGVQFLDYELRTVAKTNTLRLFIPRALVEQQLLRLKAMKITRNQHYYPLHRPALVHLPDGVIVRKYHRDVLRFCQHYQLASNRQLMHTFISIMKYSMVKTFANKYKTSVRKIMRKYNKHGIFCVEEATGQICFMRPKR